MTRNAGICNMNIVFSEYSVQISMQIFLLNRQSHANQCTLRASYAYAARSSLYLCTDALHILNLIFYLREEEKKSAKPTAIINFYTDVVLWTFIDFHLKQNQIESLLTNTSTQRIHVIVFLMISLLLKGQQLCSILFHSIIIEQIIIYPLLMFYFLVHIINLSLINFQQLK